MNRKGHIFTGILPRLFIYCLALIIHILAHFAISDFLEQNSLWGQVFDAAAREHFGHPHFVLKHLD